MSPASERAALAGGCVWGMQELIRHQAGVLATRMGHADDTSPFATYIDHEGHAEAIDITFDSTRTHFRRMLEYFFQIHDPTALNRQGNDTGSSYRSVIFYFSDEPRRIALETIAEAEASGLWPGKVITEIAAARPFWQA